MRRLTLSLLGSFQATLDDQLVTAFESDKARALLAYLAVESDRPHTREKLAGLLWPESSESAARASLSQALTNLRDALSDRQAAPPSLLASRQSIQFNRDSDAFVDVNAFVDLSGRRDIGGLEQAASLYHGRFLEGFSLPGCPEFEDWLLLEQEHLHRLACETVARLAEAYEGWGQLERALALVWQQLQLDPWREDAHRRAMRLLARSGRRDAALAQYQTCCRLLAEQLAAEPSRETVRLYEQIRNGQLAAEPLPPHQVEARLALPGFLTGQPPPVTRPTFVARETELAWLHGRLEKALSGQGQAGFVVGGPGRGKTALLHEFARRALDAHPDLLLALGTCNAYSGLGDPYLPFRTALAMLTGDVGMAWAAGILSTDQAGRLWDALLEAAPILIHWGSGLVGTILDGRDLLARARTVVRHGGHTTVDWLAPLERLVDPRTNRSGGLEQSHLFEQYANVLLHLSARHPLLLIVDDLQWADMASVGLLFHLARRLEPGRILLVGAYRPAELAVGRDGRRHPLEPVLAEFRTRFGDDWLDLAATDETEGRLFVDRLLDSEPNALDEQFRQALFRRTQGHALFTLELLRAMQNRGELVQDVAGRWVEGDRLRWHTLPPRAEAAIAERIDRLPEELHEILAVASVEGEEFTAQALALVQDLDELHILRLLQHQLAARHRLVSEQGEIHLDGRILARYRFSHFLVQQHLYQELGDVERQLLHRRVGQALEQLYEGRPEEIAVELARHFAGDPERERRYARLAGERAAAQFANEEAVRYLSRALELTPADEHRERYELLLARERVYGLLDRRDAQRQDLAQLEALANRLGTAEQAEVGLRTAVYSLALSGYSAAIVTAQAAVQQAEAAVQPTIQAWGHYWLGMTHMRRDRRAEAEQQWHRALELARRVGDRRLEAQALARLGLIKTWLRTAIAYTEAEALLRESLALAREIDDKPTVALSARCLALVLARMERVEEARDLAETSRTLYEQIGDRRHVAEALLALGDVAYVQDDRDQAERYYSEAIAIPEADRLLVSFGWHRMADVAIQKRSFEEAHTRAGRAVALGEELDSTLGTWLGLFRLGIIAAREGKLPEARSRFEQCVAMREEAGDLPNIAWSRARLGYVLARQAQWHAAWDQLVHALRFSRSGEYPEHTKDAICCLGQASVYAGCLQRGAELLGLATCLMPNSQLLEVLIEPELDLLQATLGAAELEAAMARGAALDLDQVVAEVLACETPEAYWGVALQADKRS